jgi:hypothetical protein
MFVPINSLTDIIMSSSKTNLLQFIIQGSKSKITSTWDQHVVDGYATRCAILELETFEMDDYLKLSNEDLEKDWNSKKNTPTSFHTPMKVRPVKELPSITKEKENYGAKKMIFSLEPLPLFPSITRFSQQDAPIPIPTTPTRTKKNNGGEGGFPFFPWLYVTSLDTSSTNKENIQTSSSSWIFKPWEKDESKDKDKDKNIKFIIGKGSSAIVVRYELVPHEKEGGGGGDKIFVAVKFTKNKSDGIINDKLDILLHEKNEYINAYKYMVPSFHIKKIKKNKNDEKYIVSTSNDINVLIAPLQDGTLADIIDSMKLYQRDMGEDEITLKENIKQEKEYNNGVDKRREISHWIHHIFKYLLDICIYFKKFGYLYTDLKPVNVYYSIIKNTSNGSLLRIRLGDIGGFCNGKNCDHTSNYILPRVGIPYKEPFCVVQEEMEHRKIKAMPDQRDYQQKDYYQIDEKDVLHSLGIVLAQLSGLEDYCICRRRKQEEKKKNFTIDDNIVKQWTGWIHSLLQYDVNASIKNLTFEFVRSNLIVWDKRKQGIK